MKRLICLMLSALMLFCSCAEGEDNAQLKDELDSAVLAVNSEVKLTADYMLEITFGDSATLYYALGTASWDREQKIATAFFDQTYLGASVEMKNYFAGSEMVSVENGNPITVQRDGDILLTKFPYLKVFSADDGNSIVKGSNSQGNTYSFFASDTKTLCETILGGNIYDLVPQIKKPQEDKTQYGEAKCVYTVSEGRLLSCRYEFDIKLFDTPAVTANYTPPESEYTLDLHITAKISYTDFGDNVEIAEYATPDEK